MEDAMAQAITKKHNTYAFLIMGTLGFLAIAGGVYWYSSREVPKPRLPQPVVAVAEKTADEKAVEAFGLAFKAERDRVVANITKQKAEGARLASETDIRPLLTEIMAAITAKKEVITVTLPDKAAGLNADELENLTIRRRAYAEALAARLPEDTKIEGRLIYGACDVKNGCQMELRWKLEE